MPINVCFFPQDTTNSIFSYDIDDSCDNILTDMCKFIVIRIPLDGALLVIDNYINHKLFIWIQYKTFLFQGILI